MFNDGKSSYGCGGGKDTFAENSLFFFLVLFVILFGGIAAY
jgi:hypothetical protein